jgi:uncharacterized protein YndB with AHSA1/START domain
MRAPIENVWAWLVRPDRWSEFYGNVRRARIVDGSGPELRLGSVFKWVTFNTPVTSTIAAYEPGRHIAWSFTTPILRGYHYWQLDPTDEGCFVFTEETERGLGAAILSPIITRQMKRQHQNWLEGLERIAASGPPPPAAPVAG